MLTRFLSRLLVLLCHKVLEAETAPCHTRLPGVCTWRNPGAGLRSLDEPIISIFPRAAAPHCILVFRSNNGCFGDPGRISDYAGLGLSSEQERGLGSNGRR